MASSSPNKLLVARAAAVLTTGEVAATRLDVNEAWGGELLVQLSFTLGMLTNVILKFYGSIDGTTYVPLMAPTAASMTQTLTASTEAIYPVRVGGFKFFRVSLQGTGTVTNSTATVTYRWLRRASQG